MLTPPRLKPSLSLMALLQQPQDADSIIKGLWDVGLTSFQSGMDSVRNLTGNPIAGVDPHELVDTRPLLKEMEDMLFNNGKVCIDGPGACVRVLACWACMLASGPHKLEYTLPSKARACCTILTRWEQGACISKRAACVCIAVIHDEVVCSGLTGCHYAHVLLAKRLTGAAVVPLLFRASPSPSTTANHPVQGREEFANLPRKLNICISSTRDDFPHTHINDLGYEAVRHPETGEVRKRQREGTMCTCARHR